MYDTNKIKNFIESLGGIINKPIITNGKWQQFKLDTNHTNKSGGYRVFTDTHILCVNLYKDSSIRAAGTYSMYLLDDSYQPTPESIKKSREIVEQRNFERKKENFEAAFLAHQYWSSLQFDIKLVSEYLKRKKAFNFGCKVTIDGDLIIPYRNAKGYIQTLQIIKSNSFKMFYQNCSLVGAMHKIGFKDVSNEHNGVIFIGEGYATIASVHMSTKLPCVVAGISNNLEHVTKIIVNQYPKARIIIAADNDPLRNIAGGNKTNPGLKTAISICSKFERCTLAFPPWRKEHQEESDFNDWHVLKGIGSLSKLLETKIALTNEQLLNEAKTYLSAQLSLQNQ